MNHAVGRAVDHAVGWVVDCPVGGVVDRVVDGVVGRVGRPHGRSRGRETAVGDSDRETTGRWFLRSVLG